MNMNIKKVWAAASKWKKHQILSTSSFIQRFLPQTDELDQQTLWKYLEAFPMVYVKPVYGSGGYGLLKITKRGHAYEIQTNQIKRVCKDKYQLLQFIKHFVHGKKYIIQQGIDLMSIEQHPIDFRVLLLKPQGKWEVMGIMGKLGKKEKIVTNYCQGAKAIPLPIAIKRSSMENEQVNTIEELLFDIGLEVAYLVSNEYKYVREIGLDIAIDSKEKIWIIEANTRPNFKLFKYHPDKILYPKIYRYIRHIRYKKVL